MHSKSIIRSSDAIDSHGESVSNDSVRDNNDWRGFTCGAYELLFICDDCASDCLRDFVDLFDAVSISVGVSVSECKC